MASIVWDGVSYDNTYIVRCTQYILRKVHGIQVPITVLYTSMQYSFWNQITDTAAHLNASWNFHSSLLTLLLCLPSTPYWKVLTVILSLTFHSTYSFHARTWCPRPLVAFEDARPGYHFYIWVYVRTLTRVNHTTYILLIFALTSVMSKTYCSALLGLELDLGGGIWELGQPSRLCVVIIMLLFCKASVAMQSYTTT